MIKFRAGETEIIFDNVLEAIEFFKGTGRMFKSRLRDWTEEEIAFLKENKDRPDKELAEELGRTKSSVEHKRLSFGLKKNLRTRFVSNISLTEEEVKKLSERKYHGGHTRPWTSKERSFLIKNYYEIGVLLVAKKLNRSVEAIRMEVSRLRKHIKNK